MSDTNLTPSPDEMGTSIPDPAGEPVGGGAESVPEPVAPEGPDSVTSTPEMGGADTVAANDELGLGHSDEHFQR